MKFMIILLIPAMLVISGCKTCKKGKPCGNTCIAKNLTCHKQS